MKGKQLLLLLLLVAVLGAAGYYVQKGSQSSWSSTAGGAGGKVVEFDINEVNQVHVKSATGEVNIVRKEDEWTVQERADFPANYEQVGGLVRKLWDLKTVQDVKVGPSQMPRLELVEPGKGDAAGTVVEFKNKDGKNVTGLLLGKKHMRKSDAPAGPMGGMGDMGGFPSGRYVAPLGGTKVSLVSETLDEVEAKPERWLRKDFIKVENPKSIAVAAATPGNNWKLARESASADWKFADGTGAAATDVSKPAESKTAIPAPAEPKAVTPDTTAPKSTEAKPADSKPAEPKPADAKPAEPKPAELKTDEPKPAEGACETPADPKPEPTKPADPAANAAKPEAAPAPSETREKPAPPAPTSAEPSAPPAATPAQPSEVKSAPTPAGDQLDKSKVSQFATLFSSPSFKDVLAPDAKTEETGLDKPTTVTIETFDHFTYTLSIGKLSNDAYPVRFTVSAELPKERTPGKDEKPEDKTRLDEEFKTGQKKLEEKLAAEKKLEGRIYLLEKFTVEPLLKERSALLVEAKADAAAAAPSTTTAPISVTNPPVSTPPSASTPPISVTTPPVSAPPSATTPPISVTTPPVSAPPAPAPNAPPSTPPSPSPAPAPPANPGAGDSPKP